MKNFESGGQHHRNIQAGKFIKSKYHKSFVPNPICKEWIIDDMDVHSLLSQADRQIGRLDMYSEYIPNIQLFISMHVAKEATQSSKIEGTRTNIEEAFLKKTKYCRKNGMIGKKFRTILSNE